MFSRLKLVNFQRHKKLDLKLGSITTIIGASDVGKSAVLRALRWLCQNKPSGDEFIRRGADKVTVKLKAESKTITRTKGSTNTYHLDKLKLASFGSSVPDTVADHLNVSELNFQRQHDAPFWFSLTAGQVSEELNSIVDLSALDAALTFIKSKVRKAEQSATALALLVERQSAEAVGLEWSLQASADWERLEALKSENDSRLHQIDHLERSISACNDTTQCIKAYQNQAQESENLLNEFQALAESHLKSESRLEVLSTAVESIQTKEAEICQLAKQLCALEKELQAIKTCPLCGSSLRTPS